MRAAGNVVGAIGVADCGRAEDGDDGP